MDHGKFSFSLQKGQAAVWTTHDGHGKLLAGASRAAGTAFGDTELAAAVPRPRPPPKKKAAIRLVLIWV
jgi:hypothetical protein